MDSLYHLALAAVLDCGDNTNQNFDIRKEIESWRGLTPEVGFRRAMKIASHALVTYFRDQALTKVAEGKIECLISSKRGILFRTMIGVNFARDMKNPTEEERIRYRNFRFESSFLPHSLRGDVHTTAKTKKRYRAVRARMQTGKPLRKEDVGCLKSAVLIFTIQKGDREVLDYLLASPLYQRDDAWLIRVEKIITAAFHHGCQDILRYLIRFHPEVKEVIASLAREKHYNISCLAI